MNPVDIEEGCIVLLGGAGVEETEFCTNPLAFTHREGSPIRKPRYHLHY